MRRRWLAVGLMAVLLATLALSGCNGDDGTSGSDGGGGSQDTPQEGLEVGVDAPDFRLDNQDQEKVQLSSFEGEKNVILVFYPMAFTPV
ncbi:MAG: hypothetical protein Kow0067_15190 [Coriobacteriia bacterium]